MSGEQLREKGKKESQLFTSEDHATRCFTMVILQTAQPFQPWCPFPLLPNRGICIDRKRACCKS